ncbi:olfactory receptor 5P55-like [Pseudophryne corroboree]|uniref:olfactory receptor 5P55-like n=1 Tax=Pseudophryne corroboree TaxID=495146 RepID=UPI0030815CBF
MYYNNLTTIIFIGFDNITSFKALLFFSFLAIYCATICGNLLIIMLVCNNKNLHSPMYYFLTQLSISDLILSTDIVPNLLRVILFDRSTISFIGCFTQFYLFGLSEVLECFILTVMSYDRYLAICNPLHYNSIMSSLFCMKLIIMSWISTCICVFIQASQIHQLHFCGPNIIDHFFCDFDPVLKLSCSSVFTVRLIASILSIPFFLCSFIVIALSYSYIIYTIAKMTSIVRRKKAFSTCSSHFVVVSIFYGTFNAMYLIPTKGKPVNISKALSVLYTVITPFLNPIIYSLRNKDITKAFNKLLGSEQKNQ